MCAFAFQETIGLFFLCVVAGLFFLCVVAGVAHDGSVCRWKQHCPNRQRVFVDGGVLDEMTRLSNCLFDLVQRPAASVVVQVRVERCRLYAGGVHRRVLKVFLQMLKHRSDVGKHVVCLRSDAETKHFQMQRRQRFVKVLALACNSVAYQLLLNFKTLKK